MPTKKKLDKEQTLNQYEKRIRQSIQQSITEQDRQELDGCFLSTYECYSTSRQDFENNDRKCNSAVILMRVFRSLGINILGVTSERTQHGEYVAEGRKDMDKVVYVGKFMYFTNKLSYKWRMLPQDHVYL